MLEGIENLLWGYGFDRFTESLNKLCGGVRAKAFDEGFELGEEMFYRIQVRRISGQVQELATICFNEFTDVFTVMNFPVIHHDNAAFGKGREQSSLKKSQKSIFVDAVRDDQGLLSHFSLKGYRSNQTDALFLAFRSAVMDTLSARCPAILTALSNVRARFVDEDQQLRLFTGHVG